MSPGLADERDVQHHRTPAATESTPSSATVSAREQHLGPLQVCRELRPAPFSLDCAVPTLKRLVSNPPENHLDRTVQERRSKDIAALIDVMGRRPLVLGPKDRHYVRF